jgi:hypothetical protein
MDTMHSVEHAQDYGTLGNRFLINKIKEQTKKPRINLNTYFQAVLLQVTV